MTDPDARMNLASRRLGASVVAASDEFFGEKENLLRPEPPGHRPRTFGHKGQVVDGWETRRRRGPGHDYALIRLGAPGCSPTPGTPSASTRPARPATHVRLEIHPDGGLARLRLLGELTAAGRARLGLRWFDRLPADHALAVLADECGLSGQPAGDLAGRRPFGLPAHLNWLLTGGELSGMGDAADRVRAPVLGG